MFFPSGTALLASPAPGQWTSPSDLSLLIQAPGDSPFAWTSRLAQQSLQSDFDPVLLQLFDGQPQGDLREVRQQEGQRLEIEGEAVQASLTNSFGFVDVLPDASAAEDVGNGTRVARPLAGATTAGGLDNQQAVVRLRQNSSSDLAVLFYRVDDLTGMIKGVAPGEKGYKRLSRQRAYETAEGVRWIPGPGWWLHAATAHAGECRRSDRDAPLHGGAFVLGFRPRQRDS